MKFLIIKHNFKSGSITATLEGPSLRTSFAMPSILMQVRFRNYRDWTCRRLDVCMRVPKNSSVFIFETSRTLCTFITLPIPPCPPFKSPNLAVCCCQERVLGLVLGATAGCAAALFVQRSIWHSTAVTAEALAHGRLPPAVIPPVCADSTPGVYR